MKSFVVLFLAVTMLVAVQAQTSQTDTLIQEIEEEIEDMQYDGDYYYDYDLGDYYYYDYSPEYYSTYYLDEETTVKPPFKQQLMSLLFNKKSG